MFSKKLFFFEHSWFHFVIPAEAISAPVVPVEFIIFSSAFEQASLELLGCLVARYLKFCFFDAAHVFFSRFYSFS